MDIDGTWQPRKGVETLAGKITLDENATMLPFVITKANRGEWSGYIASDLARIEPLRLAVKLQLKALLGSQQIRMVLTQ